MNVLIEGARVRYVRETPVRVISPLLRWASSITQTELEALSTVKELHREPELLSRFEPRLIRNFRYD